MVKKIKLSNEQLYFIDKALEGINILVDACIGSGKTTAIQYLCEKIPDTKKALYLTYNKLLKIDAKSKIHKKNVTVTNYHGFAYDSLKKTGIIPHISDLIKVFNNLKPNITKYDILIIDEYQDIELELSEMLNYIKSKNPNIQIIAVGDMEQKVYDKTTLDVWSFIDDFLGEYTKMNFTYCFRLSKDIAEKLGRIWQKNIKGVNENCIVCSMTVEEVIKYLSKQDPKDILCLGSRDGKMTFVLNHLESENSEKFNKKTVYASIRETDSYSNVHPKSTSAIFTTYDSSKGLERKICVVFDYTESYWNSRAGKTAQKYEILRNIFCVAASRGKEKIIFVYNDETPLSEKTISESFETNYKYNEPIGISEMFDFKYKENIEECYNLLKINEIYTDDYSVIDVKSNDELIDLSPCISIYQKECFFKNKDINKDFELFFTLNRNLSFLNNKIKPLILDKKILFLTALKTKQDRYINQVTIPFVSSEEAARIKKRLSQYFHEDDTAQIICEIDFKFSELSTDGFAAIGYADVIKNDVVYIIKFVNELSHEHFLECACFMIALKLDKGVAFNTRNNSMYEIFIPDKRKFLDAIVKTITKGKIKKYYGNAI